jgi:hypothetical protein
MVWTMILREEMPKIRQFLQIQNLLLWRRRQWHSMPFDAVVAVEKNSFLLQADQPIFKLREREASPIHTLADLKTEWVTFW